MHQQASDSADNGNSSNGNSARAYRGRVVWFNASKGFGFIRPEGAETDIFVHFSEIDGQGYRNLEQDQEVEFDVGPSPRKPGNQEAKGVRVIGR